MAVNLLSPAWRQIARRFGLERFFGWWFGELSAMMAGILSGATKAAIGRQVLVTLGTEAVIFRIVDGKVVEAGRVDTALEDTAQKQAFRAVLEKTGANKGKIALCLAPDQVLCNKLSLPLAAEENLGQVIAFEMDRIMPFKAEQVYFDYRFSKRDTVLDITLAVAPRTIVDEMLHRLSAWGVRPVAVRVTGDSALEGAKPGEPWNLLPGNLRQRSGKAGLTPAVIALAGGALLLLVVTLAIPVWQKRETVISLHPVIDKAHRQAQTAENLRRNLETALAEYNYLLDKKRAEPPVVAVLEDVTHVLPDDTWVQQFDLKGKELVIQGETGSSSKLIGLFEQARTLHNASFRAPLTKGQLESSERFQLAAETKPLPRTETEARERQLAPVIPAQEQAASAVTPVASGMAAVSAVESATQAENKAAPIMEKPKNEPASNPIEKSIERPEAAKGEPAPEPAQRMRRRPWGAAS